MQFMAPEVIRAGQRGYGPPVSYYFAGEDLQSPPELPCVLFRRTSGPWAALWLRWRRGSHHFMRYIYSLQWMRSLPHVPLIPLSLSSLAWYSGGGHLQGGHVPAASGHSRVPLRECQFVPPLVCLGVWEGDCSVDSIFGEVTLLLSSLLLSPMPLLSHLFPSSSLLFLPSLLLLPLSPLFYSSSSPFPCFLPLPPSLLSFSRHRSCFEPDPDKRGTASELLEHQFLLKAK